MLAKPHIVIGLRRWPLFRVCGIVGLGLAVITAQVLSTHMGLRIEVLAAIIGVAISAFFIVVTATKLITGEERIIYFHHEIGVITIVALLLRVLRQPLLPYLDITILGIGVFLVCGRIGCLLVGCCHGRPCRWGVRYGEEHSAAGFPSYLVGVRLFPIQAIESLCVLFVVAVGTFLVWIGRPPGAALAWYVIAYDAGRFCFEFARGDADRPYWLGFSQPQWISLALTSGVIAAERMGALPSVRWHVSALMLLIFAMIGVSLRRLLPGTSRYQLLHPKHMRQVAFAINAINRSVSARNIDENMPPEDILLARTSLGIQISGSKFQVRAGQMMHYTISSRQGAMSEGAARVLAYLIRSLTQSACIEHLIAGRAGMYHLMLRAES